MPRFQHGRLPQCTQIADDLGGSVSKVELVTPMALIYKLFFPSISTFETPPKVVIDM
jgi:hypothetical protein